MKWMQHETKERNSQHAANLRSKFGNAGYGLFWIIREVIGEQADEEDPKVTYPAAHWRQTLNISAKKLKEFLVFCAENEIFMVEASGQNITIGDRKLLNLRDDYTRKKARKNELSGQCPPRLEENRKEEKTGEEIPPISPQGDEGGGDVVTPTATATAHLAPEVMREYNGILPELEPAVVMSSAMSLNLKLNRDEHPERALIGFWVGLFHKARAAPYLMGRLKGCNWKASLPWLLEPDNVDNILNGKYPPDKGEEKKHATDFGTGPRPIGSKAKT